MKLLTLDASGNLTEVNVDIPIPFDENRILSASQAVMSNDPSRWYEFAVLFDQDGNVLIGV